MGALTSNAGERTAYFPLGLPDKRVVLMAPCLNEIMRDAYKRSDARVHLSFMAPNGLKKREIECVQLLFGGDYSHHAPDLPRFIGIELIRWCDDAAPLFDRAHSDAIHARLVRWSKNRAPFYLELAR